MPLLIVVLRLAFVFLWGARFPGVRGHGPSEVCKKPLVSSGIEGICPSWLLEDDGGVCRQLYAVHQTFSLGPITATVLELPATIVGERRRRAPCEDTREDFGLSFSCHHVLLQGGFQVSGLWQKRHLALQGRVSRRDPAVPHEGGQTLQLQQGGSFIP